MRDAGVHGGDEDYSVMIIIVIKITVINNLNEWINVRMKGYHQEQE